MLIAALVVVALVVLFLIISYNSLVRLRLRLRLQAQNVWSDIDVQGRPLEF